MHKLHSKSAVFRFRVVALLLCLKCVLVPATGGILIYSILIHDDPLTLIAMALSALCVVVILLQWLIAQRTNCPLCIAPVLANRNCAKSKHVRKLLGSHRLRLALSILLRNSFRCPYCNEPTSLEVRQRRNQQPYSRG